MSTRHLRNTLATFITAAGLALAGPATAQSNGDFMSVKRMSMGLAGDIAQAAVEACRDEGYQVTAAVLDRNGQPQVVMRDVYAPEVSYPIAKRKAYTAIEFSMDTGVTLENRPNIGQALNHMDKVLFLEGGRVIETGAGEQVGAVGVSGAPDSEIDANCAQAGLDAVSDRLQFGGM